MRAICGIPNIVAFVDGMHLRIKRPSKQQQCYFSRKQYHSIANQVVCDRDRRVVDLVTNIAGAVHDARIWASCNLQHLIEQQRILQGPVYMYGAHAIPQVSSVVCIGCCFCFTAQTLIFLHFLTNCICCISEALLACPRK